MGREADSGEYDRRKIRVILGHGKLWQQRSGRDHGFVAGLQLHAALHGAFAGKASERRLCVRRCRRILLRHHLVAMMMVSRGSMAYRRPALSAARHRPEWQSHRADQGRDCRNGGDTPHAENILYTQIARKATRCSRFSTPNPPEEKVPLLQRVALDQIAPGGKSFFLGAGFQAQLPFPTLLLAAKGRILLAWD